jgi:hypothetical protein
VGLSSSGRLGTTLGEFERSPVRSRASDGYEMVGGNATGTTFANFKVVCGSSGIGFS